MSSKIRKKGKTYYRLGTKATAGLLLASTCAPGLQATVHAEEMNLSSTSTEQNEVSLATFSEDTVQELAQSSSESSTSQSEAESSTTGESSQSGGQSSSEESQNSSNHTSQTPPQVLPKPEGTKPNTPNKRPTESSKPVDKKKEQEKKKEKIEDGTISFSQNQSTAEFIELIGKDASKIAAENNLYASVMIAQAILESASGNSSLASKPNYNIFGIKGTYQGKSVNMATLEDDGSGKMYSISAGFRKYPSYKESLQDYAKLLAGNSGMGSSFYQGAWKSNTRNYREATLYLTGRYATDTKYNQKLNGLIEAYDLQRFDNVAKVKKKFQVTRHTVKEGETLWDLSKRYGTTIQKIKRLNKFSTGKVSLKADQVVIVKRQLVGEPDKKVVNNKQVDEKVLQEQQRQAALKLKKEKEEKKLALIKVSQVGHSLTKAVPVALYDTHEYKVVAKQVKSGSTYYVEKNDTLKSISKKVNVPVERLVKWNNLEDTILTEGQVLLLVSPLAENLG